MIVFIDIDGVLADFDGAIIKKFESKNEKYNFPFHNWSDLELYLSFHHYLGTRLGVGMAAVTDLMFYDIKSLHVSGFSFYASYKNNNAEVGDYMKGAKPEGYVQDDYDNQSHAFINHAQIPQMKLLRELQNIDDRLSFDIETEEVLQHYNV